MFKSILVPIDLADREVARPAIKAAVELAEASGGTIRVVSVRSLMPVTYMEYVPVDFDLTAKADAEREMAGIVADIPLSSGRVDSVVRLGSIYGEVLEEAADWRADLIVVGSHRPSMATYLIGSNAKTIVRHAPCSVLVIREKAPPAA